MAEGDGRGSQSAALKRQALEFAEGLAAASGLEITAAQVREEADGITIAFSGPDARYLVGKGGATLDAIQYLTSLAVTRKSGLNRFHIIYDADSYRERREATLKRLATDLAAQVLSTGQEAVLDPLSPMERRIVHQALAEQQGIRTYSEGEEPERYIVIAPAN
jgi:spoIIIJ-associated protein